MQKHEAASNDLPCNVAGFCVHGSDGLLVKSMHYSLLREMMATRFPKANLVDRKSLEKSRLLMYVSAVRSDVSYGPIDVVGGGPAPVQTLISLWGSPWSC